MSRGQVLCQLETVFPFSSHLGGEGGCPEQADPLPKPGLLNQLALLSILQLQGKASDIMGDSVKCFARESFGEIVIECKTYIQGELVSPVLQAMQGDQVEHTDRSAT